MDGFFGIGPLELILIAIIALIVLGPERLPSVMREGARYIREIRKLGNELTSQFSDELKVLDEMNPRKIISEALDPKHDEPARPKPAPGQAAPPLAPKPPAVDGTTPAPAPVSSAAVIARTAGGAQPAPAPSPVSPGRSETGDNGNGVGHVAVDEPEHSILPPAAAAAPAPATQPAPALAPRGEQPADAHDAPPSENPA